MALPKFIAKLLPAKDLKPKGEITTIDPVVSAPEEAQEEVVNPKELDPSDISTIEMTYENTEEKYLWFKFHDTQTGYKETRGLPEAWFEHSRKELAEKVDEVKRGSRKRSVNLKSYGAI